MFQKLSPSNPFSNLFTIYQKLDFGWDPVFEPLEGGGQTYAEMEKDAKNAISHRGRSFAKFKDYLINEESSILKDMGV